MLHDENKNFKAFMKVLSSHLIESPLKKFIF
jgi:hypothetical protein